ncbi:MAG TPA: protein-L-isoaspartate(D-aspartate) O-methyltransferase [Chloroflexota bacterium]|nr:protein-L-isoaspartate(D-aspartate) O-methyltransferase [Chloroflexota bacterium]
MAARSAAAGLAAENRPLGEADVRSSENGGYSRQRLLAELRREGVRDERVLAAIAAVPREQFVPPEHRPSAYRNAPLPIGAGQTISQPLVVGLMTQALALTGVERVLEVGTGSGYQAAVLCRLAAHVVSVERFPALAARARAVLARLGCANVTVHVSNGTLGWPSAAPYDAIIVTAGAPEVPEALVAQLADGGRLVIPVGDRVSQELMLVTRQGAATRVQRLGPVRFVPLVGEEGWPADAEPPPDTPPEPGG